MLREKCAVADMPAAADHHQIDRSESLLDRAGDHVDVAGGRAFDKLPRLQLLQSSDLVAQPRRALEGEHRRGLIHLPLQLGQHLGRLALQEQGRVLHVL